MIGDGQTAALVDDAGAIVWLCWPRFDSDACFASLVGSSENGRWSLVVRDIVRTRRAYREDTLILETTIDTSTGSAVVLDFMPMRGEASDVVRVVRCVHGEVAFDMCLDPRFDYGRRRPRWRATSPHEAVAFAGPAALRVRAFGTKLDVADDACTASPLLRAGESAAFVLTFFPSHLAPPQSVDVDRALEDTDHFWRNWIARCTYDGPWKEVVRRSLMTMKALVYAPTGGIVAAATSSLPERVGGSRNWDYRYCWVRDATFTLLAFLHAGYVDEAKAWREWLVRALGGEPGDVQPVYGVAGEPRILEWEADWLGGYEGSRPVRFGNGAFSQWQLDVFGELIDALFQAHRAGLKLTEEDWSIHCRMIEAIEQVWQKPDRGIWESRGKPRRFVQSQVMVWTALDRCVRLAEAEHRPAPLERWRALRARVHDEICARGFNEKLGSFTRAFDDDELDASVLLMLHVGFLPPTDPRIRSTVARIGHDLCVDGFIRRYAPERSDDGVGGSEAAFLACGFWYADALVLTGERAEAERMFERLVGICNGFGLLSEEYDTAGARLVGNLPQALSHLSLVNTACNLASDAGPAKQRSS